MIADIIQQLKIAIYLSCNSYIMLHTILQPLSISAQVLPTAYLAS